MCCRNYYQFAFSFVLLLTKTLLLTCSSQTSYTHRSWSSLWSAIIYPPGLLKIHWVDEDLCFLEKPRDIVLSCTHISGPVYNNMSALCLDIFYGTSRRRSTFDLHCWCILSNYFLLKVPSPRVIGAPYLLLWVINRIHCYVNFQFVLSGAICQ